MSDKKCPWLGFKPYGEDDAPFFNGRSDAIKDLLDIVESKTITVCYAESGIGKTSLINAGLVPNLREKRYFPIWIRFDVKIFEGKSEIEVKEVLRNHIRNVFCGAKKEFEKKNPLCKLIWNIPNEKQNASLFDLWKALRFSPKVAVSFNKSEYYYDYKPILILDQFEQMLYDSNSQIVIESFFELLKSLVLNDTYSEEYLQMKEKGVVKDIEDTFKILVSLRQEYIGVLDYWCMNRVPMPSLHDNRYSLQPLTTQEAREVVLPKGYDIFENVVDQIIEIAKENNSVSSILLSVICRRLFEQASLKGNEKEKVTKIEVEKKKDSIIKDYYDDQLRKAQRGNESLLTEKIISQIEDALVIDDGKDGKRSLLAVKNDRLQGILFTEEIKLLLENNGIIRSDRIGPTTFVELIHDKVASAVLERKKERKNRKEKEQRQKANYQKYISRQNPLTLGGRRIWDNKTFSFSVDNSRSNTLLNSSNRTESLRDIIQQRNSGDGGVEQLFFDKLFRQTSDDGIISLDFNNGYSLDGISVFNIKTERVHKHNNIKEISADDFKKKATFVSDPSFGVNSLYSDDNKIKTQRDYQQIKIKEITFTDTNKNHFYTLDGFRGIRSDYDKDTGNELKREYICDGYTSVGIVVIKFYYNELGFPIKAMYFDSEDKPCKHIDGNYGVKIEYDKDGCGNETCRWFLDQDEIVSPIYNGVCGIVSEYDDKDRVIKQYFVNEKKERIFDDYGFHGIIINYCEAPNELLISNTIYIDVNDVAVNNPQGYCVEQLEYDDKGRIKMQSYFNKNRVEVEKKDGVYYYSKLGIKYGELDRIDNLEMYRLSNRTIKNARYVYNLNGTIRECSFYEVIRAKDHPIERKSQSDDNYVHHVKYEYNNSGVVICQKYYDKNGNPMNDSHNYCKICLSFNSSGNIIEYCYYRLESEKEPIKRIQFDYKDDGLCEITNYEYEIKENKTIGKVIGIFNNKKKVNNLSLIEPFVFDAVINYKGEPIKVYYDSQNAIIPGTPLIIRRKYDIDDNISEELFYDKYDKSPVCNDQGVYGWHIEYDIETGDERKRIFLGRNGKIANNKYNYAIIELKNEEYEGIRYLATYYYNEDDDPALCEDGYHKKLETESLYDDALCIQAQYFNCKQEPCNCADGYQKHVFIEDKKDNKRIVEFLDATGLPVKNKRLGYHKREQLFSNNGIEICRSFYNEFGKLANVPNGFAKQKIKRNDSFSSLFYFPFEDHDVIRFYDENDNKVDVDYEVNEESFHAYKYIISNNRPSFMLVQDSTGKTLYKDWTKAWKYIYIIVIPIVTIILLIIYWLNKLLKGIFRKTGDNNPQNTTSIIQIAQVYEVQKGNGLIAAPAKTMGVLEGFWVVKWNSWVYNPNNANTVDEFEKIINESTNHKSITLYNPIEKKFLSLDVIEKNLGMQYQKASVAEDSVIEMMENALTLPLDEHADLIKIIHSIFGRRYMDNREYDKAEEQYLQLIHILNDQGDITSRHDLADAYDDLGICLYQLDRNTEAIETMEHALSIINSEDDILLIAGIHNHLAQVYRDNEEFEKAEYHYKESVNHAERIEGAPKDIIVDNMMSIGSMLAKQEKYDECLELFERTLSMASEDNYSQIQSIHSNLAFLYQKKNEYEKAEKHYKERIVAMEKRGKEVSIHDLADAYDDYGVCLFQLDKYSKSIEVFDHALKLILKNEDETRLVAVIYHHMAQAFREVDDYEKAEYCFKECIRYAERMESVSEDVIADCLLNVGMMLVKQDKYEECLGVTERALELTSNDNYNLLQKIHANLAYLYKEIGNYMKAEEHYQKQIGIIKEQKSNFSQFDLADAYDDLGVCQILLEKNDIALETLKQALIIATDAEDTNQLVSAIHSHIAQAFFAQGDLDSAEIHYNECINELEKIDGVSGDDIADKLIKKSMVLSQKGKEDESINILKRALSLASEDSYYIKRYIHSRLGSIFSQKGDYYKAEEHFRAQITIIEKEGVDTSIHDMAKAYYAHGMCLFKLDRNDESIIELEYALQIVKCNDNEIQLIADLHRDLAMVYKESQNFEKAEQNQKELINLQKRIEKAHSNNK